MLYLSLILIYRLDLCLPRYLSMHLYAISWGNHDSDSGDLTKSQLFTDAYLLLEKGKSV